MKGRRRKFGSVFAFAALFATLAFVSAVVTSTDTAVSQPRIDLFVEKAEYFLRMIPILITARLLISRYNNGVQVFGIYRRT